MQLFAHHTLAHSLSMNIAVVMTLAIGMAGVVVYLWGKTK